MNKTRLLYVLVALLILTGVFFMGRSAYRIVMRKPLLPATSVVPAELAEVRAQDENNLESGSEDPKEIAKSLRRYAEQNLPKSKDFVLKYIDHPNKVIRAAAIESIGAYPDADIAIFQKALQDENLDYRLSAIRGMAKRSDEARISLLLEHANKNSLSEKEKGVALLGLMRLSSEQEVKAKYRDQVLAALAKGEASQVGVELSSLYELMPRDPVLIDAAYGDLKNEKSSRSVVLSLQYLASFDSLNLKKKIQEFPIHKDETYQMALIDYLVSTCPEGWAEVVDKMQNSADVSMANKKNLNEAELNVKCRFM